MKIAIQSKNIWRNYTKFRFLRICLNEIDRKLRLLSSDHYNRVNKRSRRSITLSSLSTPMGVLGCKVNGGAHIVNVNESVPSVNHCSTLGPMDVTTCVGGSISISVQRYLFYVLTGHNSRSKRMVVTSTFTITVCKPAALLMIRGHTVVYHSKSYI